MNKFGRLTALTLGAAVVCTSALHAQSGSKPAKPAAPPSSMATESSGTKDMADAGVHESAEKAAPLKVGQALPTIPALKNSKGEAVNLADATRGKSTVVIFYRGGWCPYCNTHLADLARIQPKLEAAGVQTIAISPDSPGVLGKYESENPLPYTLLSDSDHAAMKALGVAFAVDSQTQEKLKGFGIDLSTQSGNANAVLPVPAVFVIDQKGVVSFSHANADYTKRLSGEEVLKAIGHSAAMEGSATKEPMPSDEPQGSGSK